MGYQHYAEDSDDDLVHDAVDAIGYCARVVPESTQQCLAALMSFIQSKNGTSAEPMRSMTCTDGAQLQIS